MEHYPQDFKRPDHTSYSGATRFGLGRTTVPTVLANQRKYYNREVVELNLTFSMTNDEYVDWFAWVRENADEWFIMSIVSPYRPVYIVSDHRIRFKSALQYNKQGDNWLSVSVTAEVVQADRDSALVEEPVYDWIVAGNPSDPATDYVDAGSPADPATDTINPHLYWW